MRTALFWIGLCAAPLLGQDTKGAAWVGVPLGNGRALRLSTQADGAGGQTLAIRGSLLGAGRNTFHRLLTDSSSHPIFAYDLELPPPAGGGPVRLQVKPAGAEYARTLDVAVPTFSSVRTVSLSAPGERALIELLFNPKTGQKIVDVLEIAKTADALEGAAGGVSGNAPGTEMNFSHAELWSYGVKLTPQSANAIRGQVVMLYLPGLGGFFFSRVEPKGYGFTKTGIVEGNRLKFTWANRAYECVSTSPILPDDGDRQIWVFHDPQYHPRIPGGFQFGAADSVKWMLGDRD